MPPLMLGEKLLTLMSSGLMLVIYQRVPSILPRSLVHGTSVCVYTWCDDVSIPERPALSPGICEHITRPHLWSQSISGGSEQHSNHNNWTCNEFVSDILTGYRTWCVHVFNFYQNFCVTHELSMTWRTVSLNTRSIIRRNHWSFVQRLQNGPIFSTTCYYW